MPDPALLKLMTVVNAALTAGVGLALLACLAGLGAILGLIAFRLWRIFRQPPADGEIVDGPETDVVEGVFVDECALTLSRRTPTR